MKKLFIGLFALVVQVCQAQVAIPNSPTANEFSTYMPYDGSYLIGNNPGWYGFNWSTQQICDLGAGNPAKGIKGIGAKSFRMQLYDNFLSMYGLNSLKSDYVHLVDLGAKDIAVMVGGVSEANRLDTSFYYYTQTRTTGFNQDGTSIVVTDTIRPKSEVFKGMYEPIWLDAAKTKINPANTYAKYLSDVVLTYGQWITLYEVWNEPDFTYGPGGWLADADPTNRTTWFYVDPTPQDLYNLKAPVQYYIRLLRISWEVIKKLDPTAYVCTGGIGNRSFLAALLRNTDNPDAGKVTAEYPLNAGAYFDVLSFHTYPEFSTIVKWWDNSIGGSAYMRNTDRLVAGHLLIKHWMDSVLRSSGYNGVLYPKKHFICTETGTSMYPGNDGVSGNEVQKNYIIKTHVASIMDGDIKQTHWYTTASGSDPTDHWSNFGCYYDISTAIPYNATMTDQGIAQKTTSDLLSGKVFDSVKTKSFNLPSTVGGGAFKGSDGKYVFCLWAKATIDQSEYAQAAITLPGQTSLVKKMWNYSVTGTATTVSAANIQLNSTPSFFEPAQVALPVKLLAFTATRIGTSAKLQWDVAGEVDFSHYLVERSQDGNSFTQFGRVGANGSARYQLIDQNPFPGRSYYRLKLVDQDGKYAYSDIRMIYSLTELVDVDILADDGRLLRSYKGTTIQAVKRLTLIPGMYILKIRSQDGTISAEKFVSR